MTKTEELLALAEAVDVEPYLPSRTRDDITALELAWDKYRHAATPQTIKQLVELVRLQNKVITCISGTTAPILTQQMRQQAIEAFNKWESGK